MQRTISDVAKIIHAELHVTCADASVTGINSLEGATAEEISFFENPTLLHQLNHTRAICIIISEKLSHLYAGNKLVVKDARYALAQLSQHFRYIVDYANTSHNIESHIAPTATVAAGCFIGKGVQIGEKASIGANCVIEDYVTIGNNTVVESGTIIKHHTRIGESCIIYSGAVIGSEGFGYAFFQGVWHKIYHIGDVILEDGVEIGSNSTIDRGTLGSTRICTGAKIDNLVQIGHNVTVGNHTVIAACTGVAGSTSIGKYCHIGGAVKINGHITIADQVLIAGSSTVVGAIKQAGTYSSAVDVQPHFEWNRNFTVLKKLHKIFKKIV